MKDTQANNDGEKRPERAPYVKPGIEEEEVLETYALSCDDTPRGCSPRNLSS